MMLPYSGYMMVRMPQDQFRSLMTHPAATLSFGVQRSFRPLFSNLHQGAAPFSPAITGGHEWALHLPASVDEHPWDIAHKMVRGELPASAGLVTDPNAYVEPDLLGFGTSAERPDAALLAAKLDIQSFVTEPYLANGARLPTKKLEAAYPPAGTAFNPAWHLGKGFANFTQAWNNSTGAGKRIAHLDTGYSPDHVSRPKNLRPEQGYNFISNNTDVVDNANYGSFLVNPGHGTGTLALLAGNKVNIAYDGNGPVWDGYIGGAPDAEVVPVVIGHSVIHLYSADIASGLTYALGSDRSPKCDVVSLSHGGLPSAAWATAVNRLYEAGVVVVAASGDSYNLKLFNVATRYTVYPSAFYRVVTATGATFDHGPYKTSTAPPTMQGCWGPRQVSEKSIAAYTPNVPWMTVKTEDQWDMDGGGTSASTPQIAAACALWLSRYGDHFPPDSPLAHVTNRLVNEPHRANFCDVVAKCELVDVPM